MSKVRVVRHERGDLTEYDSTVVDGGDLSVVTPGLAGTSGKLACLIDDTNELRAQLDIPRAPIFHGKFFLDPNTLSMGDNTRVPMFYAYGAGYRSMVSMSIYYFTANGYRMTFSSADDDTPGWVYDTIYDISDAEHTIEFIIVRAATDTSHDGMVQVWCDGVNKGSATGIDNYNTMQDISSYETRFGAVSPSAGITGTFYIDEIIITDDTNPIDPVSPLLAEIHHETNDFSEYTSTVTDGGNLSVSADAALGKTGYGLSALINANTKYGRLNVCRSDIARLRFYVDPNSSTFADGDDIGVFSLTTNNTGFPLINVFMRRVTGNLQLRIWVLTDGGGVAFQGDVNISDAEHSVEVKLIKPTSDVSGDGFAEVWVDETSLGSANNIDNYNKMVDLNWQVRMGCLGINNGSPSGTIYLDEFLMNNTGLKIGPRIWFEAHHETNDFSEYGGTNTDGGDLSVSANAALAGSNYGLSFLLDDTNGLTAYKYAVRTYTGVLRSRIYFDPNGLSMSQIANVFLQCSQSYQWRNIIAFYCEYYNSNYTARCLTTRDGLSDTGTGRYVITDAPHYFEGECRRASSPTSSDGVLKLWVDGDLKEVVGRLDNYDTYDENFYVFAGPGYNSGTISGTFYVDEIVVNSDGLEIGPVASGTIEETVTLTYSSGIATESQSNENDAISLAKYAGVEILESIPGTGIEEAVSLGIILRVTERLPLNIDESVSLSILYNITTSEQTIANDTVSLLKQLSLVSSDLLNIVDSVILGKTKGIAFSSQSIENDLTSLGRINILTPVSQTNETDSVSLLYSNIIELVTQTNENDAVTLVNFINITVVEETQGFISETVILARSIGIEVLQEGISHVTENVSVNRLLGISENAQCQVNDSTTLSRLLGISENAQCQVNDSTTLSRLLGISENAQCQVNDYVSLSKLIQMIVIDETIGQYSENLSLSRAIGLSVLQEGISHVSENTSLSRLLGINIAEQSRIYTSLVLNRLNGISIDSQSQILNSLTFARSNGLNSTTQSNVNANVVLNKFSGLSNDLQIVMQEMVMLSQLYDLAILDSRYLLENVNLQYSNGLSLISSPTIFEEVELGKINVATIITVLFGFNSLNLDQFKSIVGEPQSLYVYSNGDHAVAVLFRDKRVEIPFRDKRTYVLWRDKRSGK